MSLDNLYELRNNFILVGLTGRSGGGCNDICEFLLSENNPFTSDKITIPNNIHINERQKYNICKSLLTDQSNTWKKFNVVKYRDILLLFFMQKIISSVNNDANEMTYQVLADAFNSIYNPETVVTRRLGQNDERDNLIQVLLDKIIKYSELLNSVNVLYEALSDNLNTDKFVGKRRNQHLNYLNELFFTKFSKFSKDFYQSIDKLDPVARQLFLQDIACNLRSYGEVYYSPNLNNVPGTKHIFTVAVAINNIIKINRKIEGTSRVVIDSLKNSLEINFFKERYSGFYLIASSRDEEQATDYLKDKIKSMGFGEEMVEKLYKVIKHIDDQHYQTKDFKVGNFTTPDVENCIQKADYYIYMDQNPISEPIEYDHTKFQYVGLELQILKFLALVQKPGLVTASAIERSMQLAFSSKYNSGCISRQVGAVITDSQYSVKSIGWNEVPQGQTPCSLRNLKELVNGERDEVYSEYEREGGDYGGKKFKDKISESLVKNYGNKEDFFNNLNGHNCPYCFKDFHNSFEGKDNQVHTRSLHAEENAMLQISKFGGQPLNGGILFTTASPCELCSKKAFQLGIKKIFYIDPYPGIARQQILKAGNDKEINPKLFMFQGAVGRGYFKLYEPYMSVKDETYIRTGLKPDNIKETIHKSIRDQLMTKFPGNKMIDFLQSDEDLLDAIQEGLKAKNTK